MDVDVARAGTACAGGNGHAGACIQVGGDVRRQNDRVRARAVIAGVNGSARAGGRNGDVVRVQQPLGRFDPCARGRQNIARSFHKAAKALELCTVGHHGLGQCAGFLVTPDDDVTALAHLAVVVLARAVGLNATIGPDMTAIGKHMHRPALLSCRVDAAALQNAGHSAVHGRGLQVHLTALGHDGAAFLVGHSGVDAGRREFQFDATRASEGHAQSGSRKRHRIGSGQVHVALRREDAPLVAHAGPQQGHITARCGLNQAAVDDGTGRSIAGIALVACHEVVVRHVERAARKSRSAHAAILSKNHAIGVDQNDTTVGTELAKNLARFGAAHAVEQDRLIAGLHHVDLGSGANVKALPIDGSTVAGLVDGQLLGALAELHRALGHLAACGQGVVGRLGPGQRDKAKAQSQCTDKATAPNGGKGF